MFLKANKASNFLFIFANIYLKLKYCIVSSITERKKYKAEMFKIEDTTSPRYKDFDRYQLNEKVNANS